MSDTELVVLYGNPSFRAPIAIKITSANGTDNDSGLMLCVESDPQLGGTGTRTKSISPADVARIWQLLDGIEIRSEMGNAIGLDGTTFTLVIDDAKGRGEFNWWGGLESEWGDVGQLADELVRLAGPDAAFLRSR